MDVPLPLANDLEQTSSAISLCTCSRCEAIKTKWAAIKVEFSKYTKINPLTVDKLDAGQKFLCHDTMKGFIFKHREWSKSCNDHSTAPAWLIVMGSCRKSQRGRVQRAGVADGFD